MRWQDLRRSTNVQDRRGMRGGLPVTGGLGLVVVLVIAALTGINPLALLGGGGPATESAPPGNDEASQFVSAVLGSTEDVWGGLFNASGQQYRQPALVIFSGVTSSGCGTGQSAMGPFYCPLDQSVYIDLSFYEALRDRLGAPGDFAQAYVIAHEVGHHVQNLLGTMERVQQTRRQRHRRRPSPKTKPGHRRSGELHARYVRTTCPLVPSGTGAGRPEIVRHVQYRVAITVAA
jgi:predicted metalloprotease